MFATDDPSSTLTQKGRVDRHMNIPLLAIAWTLASPPANPPAPSQEITQPPRRALTTPKFLGVRPQFGPSRFKQSEALGLKPLRGGGFLYQGTGEEKFDARIHEDGSVEFRDSGAFEIRLSSLCFSYACPIATPKQPRVGKKKSKKDIEASLRRSRAAKIASRVILGVLTGALPLAGMDDSGVFGPRGGSGNYYVAPPRPGSMATGIFSASGMFGRKGQVNGKKMDFLQRTRALRLELATVAQEAYTTRALHLLPRQLKDIEHASRQSPAIRRERLLALWEQFDVHYQEQELQDAVLTRLNRSMGTKLRFARRQMLAFAKRVFPRGSKTAFAPAELAKYNQGRAAEHRFEPYEK